MVGHFTARRNTTSRTPPASQLPVRRPGRGSSPHQQRSSRTRPPSDPMGHWSSEDAAMVTAASAASCARRPPPTAITLSSGPRSTSERATTGCWPMPASTHACRSDRTPARNHRLPRPARTGARLPPAKRGQPYAFSPATGVSPETTNARRFVSYRAFRVSFERETGFEPATSTLARLHSTTELLPQWRVLFYRRVPHLSSGVVHLIEMDRTGGADHGPHRRSDPRGPAGERGSLRPALTSGRRAALARGRELLRQRGPA